MSPAASTAEIRTAYRALAQRMHPDRLIDASPAERSLAERRMREVNEAWAVLSDPNRRRAYDLERAGTSRSAAGGRPSGGGSTRAGSAVAPVEDDDLVDVMPPMTGLTAGLFRHLPWVLLVLVFGVIFVLSAYAGGRSDDEELPTRSTGAAVGACLDIPTGTSTTIVSCDAPHQYEVVTRSASADGCPEGTEARRLREAAPFDCLRAG